MKVELRKITPADAAEMLKGNKSNQQPMPDHVKRLANHMKSGKWIVNGDTIQMNGSRLLDGQHRLLAIIESGCTIETLVAEEVENNAFNIR